MIYRIYTEDVNTEETIKTVSRYFDCYTLFRAVGFWLGEKENSLCFEIVGNTPSEIQGNFMDKATAVAREIKTLNKQQAVLVVSLPASAITV